MALTDAALKNAKPANKPYKLPAANGLYALVHSNGSKYWRLDYRFDGKRKTLALGSYPIVGLKDARSRRDEARKQLAHGIDPGTVKKAQNEAKQERLANSLEVIARRWLEGRKGVVEDAQLLKATARLQNDVFPWLGGKPIAEISAPEILVVLRRIDERGARYTAHKVRGEMSMIFRFAIREGVAQNDPAKDLIGAIPPAKGKHFASITEPAKVGEMLRAFDGFKGTFPVQCALRLAPMLFVRPGELRKAEWAHIDLEKAEWRYIVSKTKTDHLVPLSKQAVVVLQSLKALTGDGRYLFPSARTIKRPMSDAAINAALRRLGYDTKTEITGHGFRAMARTILHEELHQKPEVIEHQLAHVVPDALGGAYNRTRFLKDRKAMMQLWADYLDKLKAGAEVISISHAA